MQCAELHPSLCFWLCHEHSHEEEGYYDGISIFNPHEHAVMRVGMPGLKEQPTDRSNLARSRQLATAQQRMVLQGTLYPRLQVKIIRHITKPYYSNILGTKRPPSKITPGQNAQRDRDCLYESQRVDLIISYAKYGISLSTSKCY